MLQDEQFYFFLTPEGGFKTIKFRLYTSYGHISQIALDPVRSPKLSWEEPL